MDYEKKKRLAELRDSMKAYGYMDGVEELEDIFPEIKESEDKGIRKFIIDCIDELRKANAENADFNGRCSEAIAYLEKQKEQKSIISAEESLGISQEEYNEIVDECIYGEQKAQKPSGQKYEDEKLHDIVIAELGKYNGENYWKAPWAMDSTGLQYPLYFANLGAKWQKEQKPAEKPKWYDSMDDLIADALIEMVEESDLIDRDKKNRLVWIEKHRANSTEWGEEDEEMLLSAIEYVQTYPAHRQSVVDWLKSLRPQSKQEWSEEDEEMVLFWNMYYEHKVGEWPNKDVAEHLERFREWLNTRFKSLHPQPHWKPSEEQMKALKVNVDRLIMQYPGNEIVLKSLYDDLKKL